MFQDKLHYDIWIYGLRDKISCKIFRINNIYNLLPSHEYVLCNGLNHMIKYILYVPYNFSIVWNFSKKTNLYYRKIPYIIKNEGNTAYQTQLLVNYDIKVRKKNRR